MHAEKKIETEKEVIVSSSRVMLWFYYSFVVCKLEDEHSRKHWLIGTNTDTDAETDTSTPQQFTVHANWKKLDQTECSSGKKKPQK